MEKSGEYEDWVTERIEDLVTEIADRDGCSHQEAMRRIRAALDYIS